MFQLLIFVAVEFFRLAQERASIVGGYTVRS